MVHDMIGRVTDHHQPNKIQRAIIAAVQEQRTGVEMIKYVDETED